MALMERLSHLAGRVFFDKPARKLVKALKEEVIPMYYQRDLDGLPLPWIARIKSAIRTLGWRFNSDRMVRDYVTNCYIPAAGGTSCGFGSR